MVNRIIYGNCCGKWSPFMVVFRSRWRFFRWGYPQSSSIDGILHEIKRILEMGAPWQWSFPEMEMEKEMDGGHDLWMLKNPWFDGGFLESWGSKSVMSSIWEWWIFHQLDPASGGTPMAKETPSRSRVDGPSRSPQNQVREDYRDPQAVMDFCWKVTQVMLNAKFARKILWQISWKYVGNCHILCAEMKFRLKPVEMG